MVTFLLPRSQALQITQCPKHLSVARNEKEPLRIIPHRTTSRSSEGKPSKSKSANRNSWFKSITSPFTSGGGSIRSQSAPPSPIDTPTHIRQPMRSPVGPKVFNPRTVGAEDPRLPDHMRRRELKLRRTPPSSKSLSNCRSSVGRSQKCPPWWPI